MTLKKDLRDSTLISTMKPKKKFVLKRFHIEEMIITCVHVLTITTSVTKIKRKKLLRPKKFLTSNNKKFHFQNDIVLAGGFNDD
jgi:hypothetical protein